MGDIRRPKHSQEWHIQQALIAYLKSRGWHVERMIGNAFQMGVPDLFDRASQVGPAMDRREATGKELHASPRPKS